MRRCRASVSAAVFLFGWCFLAAVPVCWAATTRIVERVTDGDTIVLDGGEKVRLIGVDTPETHDSFRNFQNAMRFHADPKRVEAYAEKAQRFTRRVLEGKRVRLEYDAQSADRFGRSLAYVYRESDGLFINEELVREGYGFAYLRFPFKHSSQFREDEQEARRAKKGLWAS